MKNQHIFSLFLIILCLGSCSLLGNTQSNSQPISHSLWSELLAKHVSTQGNVNYEGFIADSTEFNQYLELLSNHHPNEKNWNYNQRKAYWINAYNAFTVKLIVDHYPVKSIKDIAGSIYKVNTAWDERFILIEGQDYDLNNIEHDILRKDYADPRIHFAINCASISCPKLINKAYTAEQLEKQLEEVTTTFINDPARNEITPDAIIISRLFKWFKSDFTEEGSLIEFINKYASTKINPEADIEYQEYNWNLNQ